MGRGLSRRQVLWGGIGIAGAAALPWPERGLAQLADAAPRRLVAERRTIEVAGKPASVFGIGGDVSHRGLELGPGERFRVVVENRLSDPTIIHWHGMTPPVEQDGVAGHGIPLIGPGETAAYDFAPLPGTHFMHAHEGFQEQLLLAAPLIVRTAEDLAADEQEVVLFLQDFTFRDPAEILAGLTGDMVTERGVMGAMVEPPAGRIRGLNHHTMTLRARDLRGPAPAEIAFDAFLANHRTLEDPEIIRVERNGRVRLRIINASAATVFWIELAGFGGTLIAVDGSPVAPLAGDRFPLAPGQRIDVRARLTDAGAYPVFAVPEGIPGRTGVVLATTGFPVPIMSSVCAPGELAAFDLEERLVAIEPLPARPADRFFRVALTGSIETYVWSISDRRWSGHVPLWSHLDQRVEMDLVNRTAASHPMHLHGHMFQVVGVNGKAIAGARRDTVNVPPGGSVRIAFEADNPGQWLFHCHNLYHMMSGMMTEVVYLGRGAEPPVARNDYQRPEAPAPAAGDFLLRDGDR